MVLATFERRYPAEISKLAGSSMRATYLGSLNYSSYEGISVLEQEAAYLITMHNLKFFGAPADDISFPAQATSYVESYVNPRYERMSQRDTH